MFRFSDGSKSDVHKLGMKGANLCEVAKVAPVPEGFIISTLYCQEFYGNSGLSTAMRSNILSYIHQLESQTGMVYGEVQEGKCPLLLSLRSSPITIIHGVMESILNLGMNDEIMEHLAVTYPGATRRFALDTYCKFLRGYGTAVLSVSMKRYDEVESSLKQREDVTSVLDLSDHALEEMVKLFKDIAPVPTSPLEQLWLAVRNTFSSIRSIKCQQFVNEHKLPTEDAKKTAIIIQKMVFGNLNDRSGTGVCFSRFVREGGNAYGNYLPMAEGDDIALNGHRTAVDLDIIGADLLTELEGYIAALEEAYQHNFQYIEFTIEDGRLYLLETNMVRNKPSFHGTHFVLPLLTADEKCEEDEYSPFSPDDQPVSANPMHESSPGRPISGKGSNDVPTMGGA